MAAGRATIASSKVGGARDLIEPGVTGWIFESGDQRSLMDVLGQANDRGPTGLAAMGNAAQALSSQWSTEASARGIRDAVLTSQGRQ